MKSEMSSKERLLLAINHSEPDHVPLYVKGWGRPYFMGKETNQRPPNQFERAEKLLEHGLDDTVGFEPPRILSSDVKIKTRKTTTAEESPLLFKEYHTPKGTLTEIVRQTRDWPHGDDIPPFTDYLVPRSRTKKFLVEDRKDLECLAHLFREPNEKEIKGLQKEADRVRRFAEEHRILVECGRAGGHWVDAYGLILGDALPWICGIENIIAKVLRDPDFVHELLDIILEWDTQYIRLIEEAGSADIIVHRGWYENASFWPPKFYKAFIAPRLEKEIDLVHKIGAKFCYIMTTDIMPLLGILKGMDVDILYGVDPVQGGADLRRVKREVGDSICLWGGISASVTLAMGTKQKIESAVTEAIKILAPRGGFILAPIDQIFKETPEENIKTMIDIWRRIGSYPISIQADN